MKAEAFDQKFDEGQEDIIDDLELSHLKRPGYEQRRIHQDAKTPQLNSHEQTHLRNL